MIDLQGRVAIVLGAATQGNMGQAIARRFVELGARVVVAGRDPSELAEFAEPIGAEAVVCDITSEHDLRKLAEATMTRHGKVDIAVNAVGRNLVKPLTAVSRDELSAIVDVQLVGTFLFLQSMLRVMEQGSSVIQISSVTARALLHDHSVYMATKAAADTLVRSAAYDFGGKGIRVNSLSPGPTVDTPMAAPLVNDASASAELCGMIPLGRLGAADDVANAAAWLASDKCFMTGEVLEVNGGLALQALREVRPGGSGGSV